MWSLTAQRAHAAGPRRVRRPAPARGAAARQHRRLLRVGSGLAGHGPRRRRWCSTTARGSPSPACPASGCGPRSSWASPPSGSCSSPNQPGGFDDGQWADIVAAMIDGFDIVVLASGARRDPARRRPPTPGRAQSRGAVLVTVGVLDGVRRGRAAHRRADRSGTVSAPVMGWPRHGGSTSRSAAGGCPAARRATLWLPDARRAGAPRRTGADPRCAERDRSGEQAGGEHLARGRTARWDEEEPAADRADVLLQRLAVEPRLHRR